MAGRGPAPKPDRIRRDKPKEIATELALVPRPQVPEVPERFSEQTKRWWEAFWTSELARAVRPELHLPALRRLGDLYDKRDHVSRTLDAMEAPISKGSQGQDVEHPLTKYLARLDAEIRQLEDRFGGNPRSLVALGLQFNEARRQLDELWEQTQEQGLRVLDGSEGGLA